MMTERQRRFVEAFLVSGNATEAARTAGYSKPRHAGSRLLANVAVQAALAAANAKITSAKIADAEERREFWTAVMRGEHDCEMKDRLKAAELLGKTAGDFIERHEHSGPGGEPLTIRVVYGRARR